MRQILLILVSLLLVASVNAESYLYEIPSFQDGLQPRFARTSTPNTACLVLNNFYYTGEQLKLMPAWVQWSAAFDIDSRIRDLYDFYDKQTDSSQILCSVSDQIFYTDDNGATFNRIGLSGTLGYILANDSIFLAADGSDFVHQMSYSENWRLYCYVGTDTVALDVRKVISDDLLIVDKNTYGDILLESWVVTPIVDTVSAIQCETWKRRCFINDGVRETLKWTGSSFDFGHYIVDSATLESFSYNATAGAIDIQLLDALSGSDDDLQEYVDYNYGVIFVYNSFPISDSLWVTPYMSIDSCSSDFLRVFADLVDAYTLSGDGMLYVVKPLNEGWAFAVDTVMSGTLDSIVVRDTIINPLMDVLTFYGEVTIADGLDSVDVDFTAGTGYGNADSFQVILNYQESPRTHASIHLVKKIDGNTFRIVRPSWLSQIARTYSYITIGYPGSGVDRDSTFCWQWGNDSITGGASKQVTLASAYTDIDSFSVATSRIQYYNAPTTMNFFPWYLTQDDASHLTNYDNLYTKFSWVAVGSPLSAAKINSLDDTLLIQYGVDTIAAGAYPADQKYVYLDQRFDNSDYALLITRIDSAYAPGTDSMHQRFVVKQRLPKQFLVRRYDQSFNKTFIFTWLAVGKKRTEPPNLKYHLLFDNQEINRDSTHFYAEYNEPIYLFKLIKGDNANDPWWANGSTCSYWDEQGESLALRILVPPWDHAGDTITLPDPGMADYAIIRLSMYPKAQSSLTQFQRMWFQVKPDLIYFSDLYEYNLISTVNYEIIGGDDDDEIMNSAIIQNQREYLKTHKIYVQTGNNLEDMQTLLRSENFGSWSSGFHAAHLENNFFLHKAGIFTFDGSSPDMTISSSVRPFFTDSMDISRLNEARAAVINDKFMGLVATIPTDSGTKTLMLDFDHSLWSTWGGGMGCYLSRTAPGSYDSTLAATEDDSAAIYVLRDTMATGNAEYISAFMDFGKPLTLKSIEKVGVNYEMESGGWLILSIYQDSTITAVYTDSVTSTTSGTVAEHHTFNIPPLRESIWFAIGLESRNADTCNIIPPIPIICQDNRPEGGL